MKRWFAAVLFGFGLTLSCGAAIKVMAIGDSMTEEYQFEIPFSAPDSNPAEANTMNWVEILSDRRDSDINFGSFDSTLLGYGDYRNAGYEYNWGIPGYDTIMWKEIIDATNPLTEPVETISRARMRVQYNDVDVVVVMLGGNDVRSRYGDLYDAVSGDAVATTFISEVTANLADIIDE
ncbi:MAG: SGNH/GDSL hydrolase family protein, partial [Verrucomicrobiae bacterium]|nr:SGNH/GDSL hydrolase family protein [Verrucomicrobiae bacterium]NNJ86536.1 hypothetical protein [Akkermansiaceae bacterium]